MLNKNIIYASEKEKYDWLWNHDYRPSKCAVPLAEYIARICDPKLTLLDIGCGDGSTVYALQSRGFNCQGLDITLAGLKESKDGFIEASAWEMPYLDEHFDLTFSTDLLEHLPPEFVDDSIAEIFRITKHRTFHSVANFVDMRDGRELHLIHESAEWWQAKFKVLNTKNLKFEVIDRKIFLMKYREL